MVWRRCFYIVMFIMTMGFGDAFSYTVKDTVNVRTFGAKGDGVANDSKAIQQGIDYARLHKAVLLFPAGIYMVSRTSTPGRGFCLLLEGNNYIAGRGQRSIIRLQANQPDFTRMFETAKDSGVDNITFDDITLDGNYQNSFNAPNPKKKRLPFEQNGLLFLNGVTNVVISNSSFINACGDGITVRNIYPIINNVLVYGSSFVKCQRGGVSLGSGYRNVSVIGCYFEDMDDDCVHSEPSAGMIGDVYVGGNYCVYTRKMAGITAAGWSNNNPAVNFVIESNYFQNATIGFTRSKQVVFYNNVVNNVLTPRNPTIFAAHTASRLRISNNIIKQNGGACFYMATVGPKQISDVAVFNNLVISFNSKKDYLCKFSGVNNLSVTSNYLLSDKVNIGVHLEANPDIINDTISNNFMENAKEAVRVSSIKNIYRISAGKIENNRMIGGVTPLNLLDNGKMRVSSSANIASKSADMDFLGKLANSPLLSGVRSTDHYLIAIPAANGNQVDLSSLLRLAGKDIFITGDILVSNAQNKGAGKIKVFVKLRFDKGRNTYYIDKEREGYVSMNPAVESKNVTTSYNLTNNKLSFSLKSASSGYNITRMKFAYFSL